MGIGERKGGKIGTHSGEEKTSREQGKQQQNPQMTTRKERRKVKTKEMGSRGLGVGERLKHVVRRVVGPKKGLTWA